MRENFEGFILAGGKSLRMGADKFLLEFEGKTFLRRAAETLAETCEKVKIVLNQTQQIETDLEIVRDIYAKRGALGGIHAGLKNCDAKFAVILAVDLPFVNSEAIENLQKTALESNKFLAFLPRQTDGKFQPLCAIYRARYCLPMIEKLLNEKNSASVRDFLELISPKYINQNRLSDAKNLLFNVNFPEDFQKIAS